MIELKKITIESALSGLSDIDKANNQIIDINSMMNAMDDYIERCVQSGGDDSKKNIGVPINYYLKPITKAMITRAWLAKYYPTMGNRAGSVDDSNSGGNGGGSSTDGAPAGGASGNSGAAQ
jgi:hypothetical protein